jgi:hypothetical protein
MTNTATLSTIVKVVVSLGLARNGTINAQSAQTTISMDIGSAHLA